jgi:hypothetical protein
MGEGCKQSIGAFFSPNGETNCICTEGFFLPLREKKKKELAVNIRRYEITHASLCRLFQTAQNISHISKRTFDTQHIFNRSIDPVPPIWIFDKIHQIIKKQVCWSGHIAR